MQASLGLPIAGPGMLLLWRSLYLWSSNTEAPPQMAGIVGRAWVLKVCRLGSESPDKAIFAARLLVLFSPREASGRTCEWPRWGPPLASVFNVLLLPCHTNSTVCRHQAGWLSEPESTLANPGNKPNPSIPGSSTPGSSSHLTGDRVRVVHCGPGS